jgi:DNA-binding response OmpR family regulator
MSEHRHILVVDDDLDMHDVVRLVLAPLACSITTCATTADGRSALAVRRPNLLILDLMLATPTEGLDWARELRGMDAWRTLPILLISSAAPDPNPAVQRALGFDHTDAFLEKPIPARVLLTTVQTLLENPPR